MLIHLALVCELPEMSYTELVQVSAALQKQILRDPIPIWNNIKATVDPFDSLEDVPVSYWPMMVRDDIGFPGAAGIHLDQDGQPFALIQYTNRWSLTASHEALEMLRSVRIS